MRTEKAREFAAGAVFVAAGLFFAGFALAQLRLGSFAQMGPGLFPFLIGLALILIGLGHLALTATRAELTGEVETVERRALVWVIAAMLAFGLAIAWFGLIPAIFALVFVAAQASEKLTWRSAGLLSAGLAFAAWAIFIETLGLSFTLLRWPF